MHLIKVNAINSTNSFAREMFRDHPQMPATCIVAEKQLQGRGQRGTTWDAEEGKNLTFSVIYPKPNVVPGQQFVLSAAVATALVEALEKLEIPRLKVKWPNDILSATYKIAGILIENVITEAKVAASVIGVGLNVNQESFKDLPSAASLKTITGKEFDREQVLNTVLSELEAHLLSLSNKSSEEIMEAYKKRLFKINTPSTFQLPENSIFTGIIIDVAPSGKLLVQNEEEIVREFDLKEIRLCY